MKTGMIKLAVAVAVVGMAAAAEAGPPEGFRPPGGHYGGFGPVVRDHRTPPVIVRDHRTPPVIIRDHRTPVSRAGPPDALGQMTVAVSARGNSDGQQPRCEAPAFAKAGQLIRRYGSRGVVRTAHHRPGVD